MGITHFLNSRNKDFSCNFSLQMIKNSLKERTVFLGIGNPLRGDDGAGCKFIRELKRWGAGRRKGIYLFNGEQLPENYLEPIVKIQPATVVLVDAVDFGAPAGEVKVFEEAGSHPRKPGGVRV